jgi:alanine or glycine:cation symporter, AGCS family
MEELFVVLDRIDSFMWSYLGVPCLSLIGLYFTFKLRFMQITKVRLIVSSVTSQLAKQSVFRSKTTMGVAPLRAFFSSIGGCIGIGNLVAVCSAIQIGGPGSLVWMWVAAFLGMLIKYAEVYLGCRYRVVNEKTGAYDGGPMYYLQKVFKTSLMPMLVAVLLALYGTETYMFNVVTDSLVSNWHLDRTWIIAGLLILILIAGRGGVDLVGSICSFIIPLFLVLYVGMCLWVLMLHSSDILPSFQLIFSSAFSGKAAVAGGVAGSFIVTISEGMARGCYSGDIGVGYASVINAESSARDPRLQARMAIFGVFIDTFIVCTSTALLVITTGVWTHDIPASQLVQTALSKEFSMMSFFMPIFIFLLGYSSMIAFYVVGLKCANFLHNRYGKVIYTVYASMMFVIFSFVDQAMALTMMSLVGVCLLLLNVYGIYKLRNHIEI